jgi:hypothetical protein
VPSGQTCPDQLERLTAATTAARPARAPRSNAANKDQPAQTIAISWKAQQRLHYIWQRLDNQRGKRKTLVAVAVARRLAGFCCAITNSDPNARPNTNPTTLG